MCKIWRASNYIYPKSRLRQVIHRGMVDEHSFPGRLETKVMIPFPVSVSFTRYPHLGLAASFGKCMLRFPAPVIHAWDLLPHLGNACLDIGTLHQTQLCTCDPGAIVYRGM
ncbi:hypothetical protein CEXT_52691 [Caerostris extrusa]|uniref:Uncharacterized protein n=1 Tax=Caerostris extrusa TaxID=172846 RepID=A0AAV4TPL1_CAEEX|nr:hypothetical protein CEXT_52691 [Caerostris extrusa]